LKFLATSSSSPPKKGATPKPGTEKPARAGSSFRSILPGVRREGTEWIGTGPSVRARARFAVAAAFLVAVPAFLVGVFRTAGVEQRARVYSQVNDFAQAGKDASFATERARAELWRFSVQPETENERRLQASLDDVSRSLLRLKERPETLDAISPFAALARTTGRIRDAVDEAAKGEFESGKKRGGRILDLEALERARLGFATLGRDLESLGREANALALENRTATEETLAQVGRDQLVIFLVLLFATPIFLIFIPGWIIGPVIRLKGIGQRIETEKLRDMTIRGQDEVAQVALALKKALTRLKDNEGVLRGKIFEIRNVLRTVIAPLRDPVLIVDRMGKINYANDEAANLLGAKVHNLEGTPVEEALFSPGLMAAIEQARDGDVEEEGVDVTLESGDGRVNQVKALLGVVRDRRGGVSRISVVLHR
jgi:PAS domain S-box-containing protein